MLQAVRKYLITTYLSPPSRIALAINVAGVGYVTVGVRVGTLVQCCNSHLHRQVPGHLHIVVGVRHFP